MVPFYSNAIGGVKLQVLEERVNDAKEILFPKPEISNSKNIAKQCPNCNSEATIKTGTFKRLLTFILSITQFIAAPISKRTITCENCGHEWKEF